MYSFCWRLDLKNLEQFEGLWYDFFLKNDQTIIRGRGSLEEKSSLEGKIQ